MRLRFSTIPFLDGNDVNKVADEWVQVLGGIPPWKIVKALQAWEGKFPPNAYEFREACKSFREDQAKSRNQIFEEYLKCKLAAMPYQHRQFIQAGIEDGVPWRGDSYEMYRRVYDETMKMRKVGRDAYKADAYGRLKSMGVRIGGQS